MPACGDVTQERIFFFFLVRVLFPSSSVRSFLPHILREMLKKLRANADGLHACDRPLPSAPHDRRAKKQERENKKEKKKKKW